MGNNIVTAVIECSKVQLFDYGVKVKMEPVEIITPDGTRTGKFEQSHPLYAHTTIRKELQ